ncbi:MAG TPA: hypothetical protein VGB25_09345 [Candidatus Binatia bacterium]
MDLQRHAGEVAAAPRRRGARVLLASAWVLASLSAPFIAFLSWADHKVGDPRLEKLQIWEDCCRDRDCVLQPVKIAGEERRGKIPVEIEKFIIPVKKGKFFPVPSANAWVCYFDRNGELIDENIRCVLYPQNNPLGNPQKDMQRIRAHADPRSDG